MDLKDFVKETLSQIAAGVNESIPQVREAGGLVNPAVRTNTKTTDPSHFANLGTGRSIFLVDFDVAVTVEEDSATNAEAKISVATLLSLKTSGESGNRSSFTNRIGFKVPLALPVDPISEEQLKTKEADDSRKLHESLQRMGQNNWME